MSQLVFTAAEFLIDLFFLSLGHPWVKLPKGRRKYQILGGRWHWEDKDGDKGSNEDDDKDAIDGPEDDEDLGDDDEEMDDKSYLAQVANIQKQACQRFANLQHKEVHILNTFEKIKWISLVAFFWE